MSRSIIKLGFFTAIALVLSVIWPNPAVFGEIPTLIPLGQIREGLSVPMRVDLDGQGNLYVADARRKAVLRFDKFGALTASFSTESMSGGGLAVTADGNRLYAACGSAVAILSAVDGELLGQLGSGEGEFGAAGFIDLDAVGFVFVADTQGRIVKVYNPQGEFVYQISDPFSATGKFPSIFALAVNSASGEVYVADSMRDSSSIPKVEVFDLAGRFLRKLSADTSFGLFLPFFGGMAFDASGRGYFLDAACSEIRVLTLPGGILLRYPNPGGPFGRWVDAAYDPLTKRLFVANEGGMIEIFGIDGGTTPTVPPITINTKPGLPHPLSPMVDSESTVSRPELIFQNATDPDGDSLTYDVRLLKGEGPVAEYGQLPEGDETTSVQVVPALEENARYVWSVQAFDGKDVSGWTEGHSFYVNAVQQPPTAPVLMEPVDAAVVDGQGVLAWEDAADPDPLDSVHYLVEISSESSFAAPILEQSLEVTSVALASLVDYSALADGQIHYWRVRAVDNHGLASESSATASFRYDTTTLTVSANMPSAKVYLSGNHAYGGRFVGETPLEIRDFSPGACSVVVERPGFEPYVVQVRLEPGEDVAVYAALLPAISPAKLTATPIEAEGVKILLAGEAPFLVDFDNDGILDLLTGDAAGILTLFRGVSPAKETVVFAAAVSLDLPLIYGACPFVVDWNNDGRKDLLVGAGDGTVTLFLNRGTEEAPAFDGGEYLRAGTGPIAVGAAAAPVVVDFDGDGAKDLVVGTAAGEVLFFHNSGSDAAPQLASADTLLSTSGPVAPFFTDWDADGRKDLLLGTGNGLYLYGRQVDGTFVSVVKILDGKAPAKKKGKRGGAVLSAEDRLHLFVLDLDGKGGKDLMVGNSAGEIFKLCSQGTVPTTAFWGALPEKVAQISQRMTERTPELEGLLSQLTDAIRGRDLKNASHLAKKLSVLATKKPAKKDKNDKNDPSLFATAVGELAELLK